MFLSSALSEISIADAGVIALLGYAVVFFGLILLMLVVMALGKAFTAKSAKPAAAPAAPAAAPAAVTVTPVASDATPAPGTAGKLKLHDVPPKTAAMLMAIVANKMGKPLNELRFNSIKEVK